MISSDDEIVLAVENHLANIDCWIELARETGASIVWWEITGNDHEDLVSILSNKTRVVAISHVSNIFGEVHDLPKIGEIVKSKAPRADLVVDGVAAVPHVFADLKNLPWVDWYVISAHKLFGPRKLSLSYLARVAESL